MWLTFDKLDYCSIGYKQDTVANNVKQSEWFHGYQQRRSPKAKTFIQHINSSFNLQLSAMAKIIAKSKKRILAIWVIDSNISWCRCMKLYWSEDLQGFPRCNKCCKISSMAKSFANPSIQMRLLLMVRQFRQQFLLEKQALIWTNLCFLMLHHSLWAWKQQAESWWVLIIFCNC